MKTKKILSVILAVLMVAALGITAFAADDGSITITNATIGEEYELYKVFDLTYDDTTDPVKVAYTYKKTGETDAFYAALTASGSPFTLTETGTANLYSVTSTADGAAISAWLTANKDNLTKIGETVTADSETVVFDDLAYGYYYITSTLGTVVTVDSTLKDVEVIDKNQGPDNFDKYIFGGTKEVTEGEGEEAKTVTEDIKLDENSANYGDEVEFKIVLDATQYVGTTLVTKYTFHDVLDPGFDKAEIISVKVGDTTLTTADYTNTFSTTVKENDTFDLVIPFATEEKPAEPIYGSNCKIEIYYKAKVNTNAVLAGKGNLNTATWSYNDEKLGGETTTTTYVFAIGILKVDGTTGETLTGATFTVDLVTAGEGENESTLTAIKGTGSAGEYNYGGTETVFATDDNGVLVLKGLAAGTYSITEKDAPKGYNPLKDPITVTISVEDVDDYENIITNEISEENSAELEDGENVVPVVIENNAGTELPSTGGIGTTIFYVLGSILLVGAGVLLITKKRMNAKGE